MMNYNKIFTPQRILNIKEGSNKKRINDSEHIIKNGYKENKTEEYTFDQAGTGLLFIHSVKKGLAICK